MGTEINCKNSFPGYYSMRYYANEDSNNSSCWHLFYTLTNRNYYDGFTSTTATDAYSDQDKDGLKQKMLQQEAIFKNQVYELHRLYRRQRDMMEEVKRKEFHKYHISIDTSSSSSLRPTQKLHEDVNRWQNPSFPLGNSTSTPSVFGVEISNSPLSCSKGNGSKNYEVVGCRPSKVRKKLFDLQLLAYDYIEPEETKHIVDNQNSEISSYPAKKIGFLTKNEVKAFLDNGEKKEGCKNNASDQHFMQSNGLGDLNEPASRQDIDFLGLAAKREEYSYLPSEGKSNLSDRLSSCPPEPGNGRSNMNHTSQCFETSKLQTPSNTMQHFHGKEVLHRRFYSEISSKMQAQSHFNRTPLLFSPPSTYQFTSTSHTENSWVPPWGKSNDSLTHKLTFFQTHPSFLSSHKSHEVLRNKWHRNGSKEVYSRGHLVGFDYRNDNKLDTGSQEICKSSSFAKDMDLNYVQNLSNEDDNTKDCDQAVLPWLKTKTIVCKNGDHPGDVVKKNDNLSSGLTSASVKQGEIDINVAWEDDDMDKQIDVKKDEEIKNQFDLNSRDDHLLLVTESFKSSNKKIMEIDLEAPAGVTEIDEEDQGKENKELETVAAEAIVAISSQQDHVGAKEANDKDPHLWFVDVVNSCEKNITCEIDEYELLTLRLEETEEKDYMPKPLDPDIEEPDEVDLSSRPRRRGRPRRDILPSMTCLSRQEITEDLAIFGGLIRATGYSWKNGKRKMKASVSSPPMKLSSKLQVEGLRLDEGSLTGWGKTTRRPPRQRYAAVAIQLT